MRRRTCLAAMAAIMLAVATPLLAADGPVKAAKPELKTVKIIANAELKESALPGTDFKIVARAAAREFKHAKFGKDGPSLIVSIPIANVGKNKQIAVVRLRSDCPNNSQYEVTPDPQIARLEGRLKTILLDWTRHRHNAMNARQLRINITALNRARKNYDVQLEYRKETAVRRRNFLLNRGQVALR